MSKVEVELESIINEIYAKTTVTQKFKNDEENPIELKIFLYKNPDILFTSFQAKIGDSITVKSKFIKKEKATVKYTDSISSGNAAIFVAEIDDKIIINMGNIPPKEEIIFVSEFIHFIKYTDYYEFEIFRNLPIFFGKDDEKYPNYKLKENIYIKAKNKITTLSKDISLSEIKIKEEKYLNEEKNEYFISYEIENLPSYYYKKNNCSKIYFNTIYTEPKIFLQKSKKFKEDNYIIQYKYKPFLEEPESEISPALFIFLIDQSGSMKGKTFEITKKALELFMQSLPAKSYYQLIGFGTYFVKYDKNPKEYIKRNIEESIKIIRKLYANLGGTDILSPLKNIFSKKIYDEINLTKNIFLLTDGKVDDKEEVLNAIRENNSKFRIFSIGIGNYFDEDLIKRSGLIGKGSYNFCKDVIGLNSIVAREINNINNPWINKFKLNCDLDNENIIKRIQDPYLIKTNDIFNFNYIIPRKNKDKIKFEIIVEIDGKKGKKEEIKKKYEIVPMEFPEGEELSKLLINNDLKNKEKNLDKAIKYQILNENTALFAEIELSNQITDEMKIKILGDEEKNVMEIYKPKNMPVLDDINMYPMMPVWDNINMYTGSPIGMNPMGMGMNSMQMGMYPMGMGMNSMQMGMNPMGMGMNSMQMGMNPMGMGMNSMQMGMNPMGMGMNNMSMMNNNSINPMMEKTKAISSSNISKEEAKKIKILEEKNKKKMEEKEKERKYEEESRIKKVELEKKKSEEKEKLMEIIKTQDYIDGFWDVNKMTKFIFEKYKKEYDLLKEKNINDKVAMTILMIYYIKNEYFELLTELVMIVKKGEVYIKKEINCSYDEIIEKIK